MGAPEHKSTGAPAEKIKAWGDKDTLLRLARAVLKKQTPEGRQEHKNSRPSYTKARGAH